MHLRYQIDADHVHQHGIPLALQDVVELFLDLLQIFDDFVHLLSHRELLHHRGQRNLPAAKGSATWNSRQEFARGFGIDFGMEFYLYLSQFCSNDVGVVYRSAV